MAVLQTNTPPPIAPHRVHHLRKFRFNRPQQIAAVLLAILLAQCLWVIQHDTLSDTDYSYARCGREMWQSPSPLAALIFTLMAFRRHIRKHRIQSGDTLPLRGAPQDESPNQNH